MANDKPQIVQAKTLSEVFYHLKTIQNLRTLGAGTVEQHLHVSDYLQLTESSIFLQNIEELCQIEKKERYIDIGAATSLSKILSIGKNKIPSVLYEAILATANPLVRNIATIGGNICCTERKMTLFSPLLALETNIECKASVQDSNFIPVAKFDGVKPYQIVSKFRIPIEEWDVAIFKKVGPSLEITDVSASFTFLAQSEKGILTDVRISFCGLLSLRSIELENRLIGTRLPLSTKLKNEVLEAGAIYYFNESAKITPPLHPILYSQYLELLEYSLDMLS